MASILATGYIAKPSTLPVGKSYATRWHSRSRIAPHRCFQEPEKLRDFNVSSSYDENGAANCGRVFDRREVVTSLTLGILGGAIWNSSEDRAAFASAFADMPALRGKDYGKTKMRYPDYTETESGLQYKDLREGSGPTPKKGETVVVDWDGYTIGYYGRIFEARNKTKGGSFEGEDKAFFKFRIGSQQVIPAFEEAVSGMALGGIRRFSTCFPEHSNFKQPRFYMKEICITQPKP